MSRFTGFKSYSTTPPKRYTKYKFKNIWHAIFSELMHVAITFPSFVLTVYIILAVCHIVRGKIN